MVILKEKLRLELTKCQGIVIQLDSVQPHIVMNVR